MRLALETARRATCLRRGVGAVLLNERGHVLATGYNGVASGLPHCNHREEDGEHRYACPAASAPSGTQLEGCQAIHAEQNALLQCRDVWAIRTCYVTVSPCVTCTKLLLNTGCQRIVFLEPYPHPQAGNLWTLSGRLWEQLELHPGSSESSSDGPPWRR